LKRKYQTEAVCDTFAVDHDWRGVGLGKRMMSHVLDVLRAEGVAEVVNGYRMVYGAVPLFEKLDGFTLYEKYYKCVLQPTASQIRVQS